MGRPREIFCKIEPRFIQTNERYHTLTADERIIYLHIWIKGFDNRNNYLENNEGLVSYLQYVSALPRKNIQVAIRKLVSSGALLVAEGDGFIIKKLKEIHRGIKFKLRNRIQKTPLEDTVNYTQEQRTKNKEQRTKKKNKEILPSDKPKKENINGWSIWCDAWKKVWPDAPYPLSEGADTAASARLFKSIPDKKELMRIYCEYLNDKDDFIAGQGYALRALPKIIAKYRCGTPNKKESLMDRELPRR